MADASICMRFTLDEGIKYIAESDSGKDYFSSESELERDFVDGLTDNEEEECCKRN